MQSYKIFSYNEEIWASRGVDGKPLGRRSPYTGLSVMVLYHSTTNSILLLTHSLKAGKEVFT